MDSERPTWRARSHAKKSTEAEGWYATFSLLDVGGALSASQLRRIVVTLSRMWRGIGRFFARSRVRTVGF